jgi:hypothetical protein
VTSAYNAVDKLLFFLLNQVAPHRAARPNWHAGYTLGQNATSSHRRPAALRKAKH